MTVKRENSTSIILYKNNKLDTGFKICKRRKNVQKRINK